MKITGYFLITLSLLSLAFTDVQAAGGAGFALKVSLLPARKPLVISLRGGAFDYSVKMENTSKDSAVFDTWIDAELPDGSVIGPILVSQDNVLPSGDVFIKEMIYKVPENVPGGIYNIKLSVGDFPLDTYDSDEFSFIKGGLEGK